MWILWKMKLWKCDFCENWSFENVNFVKNETLKLWILWKMRLWNYEFCQKWDFHNVNFVKNEDLKMWILSKMLSSKCEFLDKLRIFAPVCNVGETNRKIYWRVFFYEEFFRWGINYHKKENEGWEKKKSKNVFNWKNTFFSFNIQHLHHRHLQWFHRFAR